jgi:hypothetical protein
VASCSPLRALRRGRFCSHVRRPRRIVRMLRNCYALCGRAQYCQLHACVGRLPEIEIVNIVNWKTSGDTRFLRSSHSCRKNSLIDDYEFCYQSSPSLGIPFQSHPVQLVRARVMESQMTLPNLCVFLRCDRCKTLNTIKQGLCSAVSTDRWADKTSVARLSPLISVYEVCTGSDLK